MYGNAGKKVYTKVPYPCNFVPEDGWEVLLGRFVVVWDEFANKVSVVTSDVSISFLISCTIFVNYPAHQHDLLINILITKPIGRAGCLFYPARIQHDLGDPSRFPLSCFQFHKMKQHVSQCGTECFPM